MPRDGAANAFLATLLPKLPVIDALFRPLAVDAAAAAAAAVGAVDGAAVGGGDVVGGGLSTAGPPTVVRRRCLYASAATVAGAAAHGSGLCNGSRAAPTSLRPAVLLPEVVRHAPPSGLVKAIVARLLPHRLDAPSLGGSGGGSGGDGGGRAVAPPVPAREWPRALYGGDIRRAGDGATTCYRSVVAAPRRLPPPDALVGALTFFASNRLSRTPPPPPPPPCVVPVTLLQPHEAVAGDEGGGGRQWDTWEAGRGLGATGGTGGSGGGGGGAVGFPPALANAEALITALHARARSSVNARRLRGGVTLRVRVVRPGGVPTRELMAALQRARVVLAPHDPTVAAALFLRPGATLVEVAPFAYYGGGVAALAGSLGVTYRRVVAPPDTPTFRACVAAVAADGWGDAGPPAGVDVPAAAAALLAAWDAAADAYAGYGKVDGLRLDLGVGAATTAGGGDAGDRVRLPRERDCARGQRLAPDPAAVAATVVAAAVEPAGAARLPAAVGRNATAAAVGWGRAERLGR
ncbi:hypothetical protein I4F81_011580 [Pyropia yezoensis]|uniref:Uncharacterized protein n=1 Tax=Pyropia yezoensis TaxID=2788 RepID=A0ACC3CGV2_PYRYE|nr:hypothetical protein I4F81_011580 [Neopyropia yezoensis]